MHVRRRAGHADRLAGEQDDEQQPAGGEHHGSPAEREHRTVRHVSFDRQPPGCSRNVSRDGSAYTAALYPHDHDTLGTGRPEDDDRQYAGPARRLYVQLHVGWCDQSRFSRPDNAHGKLSGGIRV